MRSPGAVGSYVARTAIWIPATVIGLLYLPMAVTQRTFGPDWTIHLWAIRQQQWNIEAMGHPGLFMSAKPLGAFFPIFAFIGSGIYSVGGYLAIVLGDRPLLAYKLLYLAGLGLAYGGFTWLSVQFGLKGWRSQVPGAVLVTGTYFITNMVGRGDFGEFMAVSSIPFLIASVCCVMMSPRLRHWHRLAVVVAVFVITGSHNITLLFGGVFVAMLAVVAFFAWAPTWRRRLPWRRVAQLAGLAAIGAGLNAWYLLPDLAYGLDTQIATFTQGRLPPTRHVEQGLLFSPLRPADHVKGFPPVFGYIRLSLPVLFFGWAVIVAVVLWRKMNRPARWLVVALVALTGLSVRLIISQRAWKAVPKTFYNIQFTYRVASYVLLSTALLVAVTLLWQAKSGARTRRWTTVLLVAIVVFNVGGATWQVWKAQSIYFTSSGIVKTDDDFAGTVVASRYVKAPSWYSIGDFRDISAPVVFVEAGRTMTVPLEKIHGSSFSGTLAVPDGPAPFGTNLTGGARYVRMTGIRAIGITTSGFVVAVRRSNAPPTGPVAVTIRQAKTAPLRVGSLVSMLSVIALLALIAWPARRFIPAIRRRQSEVGRA